VVVLAKSEEQVYLQTDKDKKFVAQPMQKSLKKKNDFVFE